MRNKIILLGAAMLTLCSNLTAQNSLKENTDYTAIITRYNEALDIYFDKSGKLVASTTVLEEKEILKKEGALQQSDDNIYHSFFSELGNLKAYTLTGNKGRKKIPLLKKETKSDRSNSIFYEDGKVTTVYFSELEPGAKSFLEYNLRHRDINIIPSKFLQAGLPIENFEYTVSTPSSVNIRFAKKYFDQIDINYTVEKKRNKNIYRFSGQNIPPFVRPEYSPGLKYTVPHVVTIIEDYKQPKSGKQVLVNKTVGDLYNYYQSYMGKANEAPTAEIKKQAAEIVGSEKNKKAQTKLIFDWVKSKIRYVAFEDAYNGFVPRIPQEICAKRYGDCKDMATLLVSLLRSQNIDAYHTWIGTRDIPYSYNEVPTTASDNHMICAVQLDGEFYFLDATNSHIPFGYIPDGLQNKEALVGISKDSFLIKKLSIAPASQNLISDTTHMKLNGSQLSGSIKLHVTGYKAFEMITYLSYKDKKDKEDYIKSFLYRGSNKCLLDNVAWSVPDESSIVLTANFKLDDFAQEVGGDIYIKTMLTDLFSDFRIKEKDRKSKVDNQWAKDIKYVTFLEIPAGYEVAFQPKSVVLEKNNHYLCTVSYQVASEILTSKFSLRYDLVDIEPQHLSSHNDLVNELVKSYKEVVHLKKIK